MTHNHDYWDEPHIKQKAVSLSRRIENQKTMTGVVQGDYIHKLFEAINQEA